MLIFIILCFSVRLVSLSVQRRYAAKCRWPLRFAARARTRPRFGPYLAEGSAGRLGTT